MNRLDNKVAVITGGASGIGRGIAEMFGKEGADVCIADIDIEGAKTCAAKIQEFGCKSLAVEVDVTNIHDIDGMVNSIIDRFGRIDILVNDVGGGPKASILELTEEQWDILIDLNVKGLFFVTQRVVHHMIKENCGKIINIASNYGAVGRKNASVYAASKAAVISLTKSMALEFAEKNINVNAIGPAFTATPLTRPVLDNPELLQPLLNEIPLGRPAQPEDIAAAAVYLASGESDFVTGQTIFVDGGFLCGNPQRVS